MNTVTLEAGSLGQVIVPQLFGGQLAVTIVSNGILPAGQMRELRGFTVTASAANFAALTTRPPALRA
ncbi:MAG: hypothetical protein U1F65_07230 [Verrucomicrobiota bacterium]